MSSARRYVVAAAVIAVGVLVKVIAAIEVGPLAGSLVAYLTGFAAGFVFFAGEEG